MTIDQFNRSVLRHQRQVLTVICTSALLIILYFAIVVSPAVQGGTEAEPAAGGAEDDLSLLIISIPAFVALFVAAAGCDKCARADRNLFCPHCNKSLADNRALVVATRNCHNCGKQVLDEPA